MKKTVTLNPGESKVVTFSYTPAIAKSYQVNIDGLIGSFMAIAPPPLQITKGTFSASGYTYIIRMTVRNNSTKAPPEGLTLTITGSTPYLKVRNHEPTYNFGPWEYPMPGIGQSISVSHILPESDIKARVEQGYLPSNITDITVLAIPTLYYQQYGEGAKLRLVKV